MHILFLFIIINNFQSYDILEELQLQKKDIEKLELSPIWDEYYN